MDNAYLLLETLGKDIPAELKCLLDQDAYKTRSLEYISNLFSQETDLVLTSNVPDSSSPSRSIVEEIAELDLKQHKAEQSLKEELVKHIDLIISSNEDMKSVRQTYSNEFPSAITGILNTLKEDNTDLVTRNQSSEAGWKLNMSRVSSVLQNMDPLMDILELPALTNLCVKQGQYAECVEIFSHVRRLAIRYSDIAIVREIEKQVNADMKVMISGLLRLLHTDLHQSFIFKIMAYLKRLGPLSEVNEGLELNAIFLDTRFQFVINELASLDPLKKSGDYEKYIKRVVEVVREHAFATVTSCKSIFLDTDEASQKLLMYQFVTSTVNKLGDVLIENLPLVKTKSAKEGLLLQILYCCQSLSRIGGDFSIVLLDRLSGSGLDIVSPDEWHAVLKRQKNLMRDFEGI